jgi:hypothetical protein
MRVLTFADGFVSASPPDVEGRDQESYNLLNNQTNTTLFSIDSAQYKSAFLDFELSRSDVSDSYVQTGSITLFFDGTNWIFSFGLTQNDEIISDSLDNPFNVVFSFTNALGVGTLKYSSGNMGASYNGKLKVLITRVKVV